MSHCLAGARIAYRVEKSPSLDFCFQFKLHDMDYAIKFLEEFQNAEFALWFKPVKHVTMASACLVKIGSGQVPNFCIGVKYKPTKDCVVHAKVNEQAELTVCSNVQVDSRIRICTSFCMDMIRSRSAKNTIGVGIEWTFCNCFFDDTQQ